MAYTLWLKHVAVIDLVTIASGFVLRAAGGAVAVDVTMSKWFVLCTVFGSLFIVTGKRYAELRDMGDDAPDVRSTLGSYTPGYLRIVLSIVVRGGDDELLPVGVRDQGASAAARCRSTSCRSCRC